MFKFTAQGLMITARNYLDVYIYEKWNTKEIPVFDKGDEFQPTSIEVNYHSCLLEVTK